MNNDQFDFLAMKPEFESKYIRAEIKYGGITKVLQSPTTVQPAMEFQNDAELEELESSLRVFYSNASIKGLMRTG